MNHYLSSMISSLQYESKLTKLNELTLGVFFVTLQFQFNQPLRFHEKRCRKATIQ